jgi:hypothetical protein
MGSVLQSEEFKTKNDSIEARIEYMTVNHSPFNLQSGLLVFLYLRNTNAQTGTVYTDNATFSLSSGTKKADFIKNGFLSVPYIDGQKWCKVGAVVLNGFQHTKKLLGGTECNVNVTLNGSTAKTDFGVSKTFNVDLDSLYLGRTEDNSSNQAHPAYYDTTLSKMTLGDTVSFKIKKDWKNVRQKIRYFFGDSSNNYKCFFDNSGCTNALHDSENDEFVVYNSVNTGTQDYYFNLLKGDSSFTELNRVNQVRCRDTEMCVIILESYIGLFSEYLGNRVLLVTVNLPDKYKPSVVPGAVDVINANETVNGWGIALQGFSKAQTSCQATPSVNSDNAQIVKYEISIQGGSSAATNEVETDIFRTSGTKTFAYKATDSRGRTAEATKTLTVYPYFLPEVSFAELYRCDENGKKADKGSCLRVEPLSYFASCNGNNEVTFTCNWKKMNDATFDVNNEIEVSSSGTIIDAGLLDTSSYVVVLGIKDSLNGYSESISQLTSGKVLLHFNIGGNSVGIGMYNYVDNSCKIGYDLFLGEQKYAPVDYVIKSGKITKGTGKYYQRTEKKFENFDDITWKYEKYFSGKVELWGTCKIESLPPDETGKTYVFIYTTIPEIDDQLIIDKNSCDLMYVGGVSDELALLSKGTTDGYSGSGYIAFLLYRSEPWTTISPTINFHVTAIPK